MIFVKRYMLNNRLYNIFDLISQSLLLNLMSVCHHKSVRGYSPRACGSEAFFGKSVSFAEGGVCDSGFGHRRNRATGWPRLLGMLLDACFGTAAGPYGAVRCRHAGAPESRRSFAAVSIAGPMEFKIASDVLTVFLSRYPTTDSTKSSAATSATL